MTRLIDADALERELMKAFDCEDATQYGNKDDKQKVHSFSQIELYKVADIIKDTIYDAPTVTPDPDMALLLAYQNGYKSGKESTERPKGEWAEFEGGYRCFNCDGIEVYTPNFCPNCGAKMVNDSVINAIRDNNKRYDERPTIDFDGMQYDLSGEE